ncbi:MAG: tail fiber domain-containing protein [Candidatus Omnitrophota bacterium]|nr:tail fiber domain-containing protein [Candidatus Omnitrophota bacterium]
MRPLRTLVVGCVLSIVTIQPFAAAGVPTKLAHQGRLLNSSGQPIVDPVNVTFALYSTPSGGTTLWSETHTGLDPDAQGFYETFLGETTPLPSTLSDPLYLQVTVGAEALAPRLQVGSVPFALTAGTVVGGGGGAGGWTDDGAVVRLTTGADKVGIGTTSPTGRLEVKGTTSGYEEILNIRNSSGEYMLSLGAASSSQGTLGIYTNIGARSIYFDSTGDSYINTGGSLGIGTTGPTQKLHVVGSARITGLVSCNTIDTDTSGNLVCGTDEGGGGGGGGWTDDGAVVRLTIVDDNVGIGTSSPASKLDVAGTITGAGLTISSGTVSLPSNQVDSAEVSFNYAASSSKGGPATDVSCVNCVTLGTETTGAYDSTADTIADNGTITLGTETTGSYDPTADAIADDGTITLGTETTGSYDSTPDTIADDGVIALGTETSGSYDGTPDSIADDGVISDGEASDVLTINNGLLYAPTSGNVGIGTTAPAAPLHINAPFGLGTSAFRVDIATTLYPGALFIDAGSAFVGIGTTSPAYRLDVAGQAHATSFPTSSDARLKTNIVPLTGALSKLEQIRGVEFDWNATYAALGRASGHREIGVIAQDVEAVFPELITTWGPEGYRAVDYGRLTGVLIEAIKELKAENKALQARIEALETR